MIVVSQWIQMLEIVAQNLDEREIEYCEIKGKVRIKGRNKIVDDFNNLEHMQARVMLLSLGAGGIGLNLAGANRMFLLDIQLNPALEQLCADRIHRVG